MSRHDLLTPLPFVLLGALAGCASTPTMGPAPDAVPPRLIATDKKDPATGQALLDWDRPGAFGAISGDMKSVGDGACMAARVDLEALGYHPAARDQTGAPLPGGGFYCYPKRNGVDPDAVAPKLVSAGQPDASGRAALAWDRPGAFGKVPEKQQAAGDVACMLARIDLQAIAYHPQALGADARPLAGGGYYCYRKKAGDAPAATPPRLVRQDGMLGWDRPSAFGAVPAERKTGGDAVCSGSNTGLQAIGYHPAALDEQGVPIQGGGYFCAVTPGSKPASKVVAKG